MDKHKDNMTGDSGQEADSAFSNSQEAIDRLKREADEALKRPWMDRTIPWSGRDMLRGVGEFEGDFKYDPWDHERADRFDAWCEVMARIDHEGDMEEMYSILEHVRAYNRFQRHKAKKEGKPTNKTIAPKEVGWIEASKTKPRAWLYKPHYIRGFMSSSIAPGGIGKTSLGLAESLAMVTGKPILGIQPHEFEPLNVWYWNGEDPQEELERRWAALLRYYKIKPQDIKGRFYMDSGRDLKIKIARVSGDGDVRVAVPTVDAIIETMRSRSIDVLHIDPFVSSHVVPENANEAMQQVAEQWAHIANQTDSCVELWHHSRKTGGRETTFEDGRGASAVGDAARGRRVLNKMSEAEATKAGIEPSQRGRYFWADHTGSSMIAPAESREWYKLETVNLHNGEDGLAGDDVGVATSWEYTGAAGLDASAEDQRAILDAIRAGGPWREHAQAKNWIGHPFASVLKLDPEQKKDRVTLKATVDEWIVNGVLEVYSDKHPDRPDRDVDYVRIAAEWEFA
jgi:hypothetical protein